MTLEEFENIIEQEGEHFDFVHNGYSCYIRRHLHFKNWSGYIKLTTDNKLHLSYLNGLTIFDNCDVPSIHGGWTYEYLDGINYIIGFDCAHCSDISLLNFQSYNYLDLKDKILYDPKTTYKTKSFVIDEIKRVCDELDQWSTVKLRQKKLDYLDFSVIQNLKSSKIL